jgi:hypothetical protein
VLYSTTLLSGSSFTTGAANITFTGEAVNDKAGFALAAGADVNNDGYTDLLIGAPQSSTGKGKAYLVYGQANWSATINLVNAHYVFSGETTGTSFNGSQAGYSVVLYDADGDTYDDVVIGSPAPLDVAGSIVPKSFFIRGADLDHDTSHTAQVNLATIATAELVESGATQFSSAIVAIPDNRNTVYRSALVFGMPCAASGVCDGAAYLGYLYTDGDQDTYNYSAGKP